MSKAKAIVFVAVLFLFFAVFGCVASESQPSQEVLSYPVSFSVFDDSNTLIFSETKDFNAGTNAFGAMVDLLGDNMEYKEYDFGVMVSSIYGVDAPSTHYWALYVDNNYASAGIKDYVISGPLNISWRLEKIESFYN